MSNQRNIIVIGGGAAGMIAAIAAAKEGCAVSLYEKMKSWAKDLYYRKRPLQCDKCR